MISIFRASVAVWAMSLAIGLMPRLVRHAAADELPGAMKKLGVSASVPATQFALLIALTFLLTFLLGRYGRLLAEHRWAAWSCSIALASAPVSLMTYGNFRHVILHGLAAAAIFFLRRLQPRFTRADVALIPALLVLYFAFLDLGFGGTPVATFIRAALILFAVRLAVRRAVFAAAPLGFLLQAWPLLAVLWVLLTPVALLWLDDAKLRRFAAYVAYPIGVAAYTMALVGWTPPIVDFFEDAHGLLPASEMARHERPYRNIAPIHGFLSDGFLDFVAMKTLGDDLGTILKTRQVIGALVVAAIYFVALAATTSADLALLAAFLSLALFPSNSVWLRALAPLLVLACAVAGTRLRAPRWFTAAGVLLVISALLTLDLTIFSACVAVVAAIRMRAVRNFALGFAAAAIPVLLVFLVFGVLFDFVRSSAIEVLGTSGIYVQGLLELPEGLNTFGAMVARIGDAATVAGVAWFIALIGSAAALTASPLRARRSDAVWMIALWIVLAGASYVVRRHYYFGFAVAPFMIAGILAVRRRSRTAAFALAIVIAVIARPFAHVFDVATPLRKSHGIVVPGFAEYRGTSRGHGAVFAPATLQGLATAQKFLSASLRPEETFYDFSGSGLLYYLFNRDNPVRFMTVPATERVEAQREVIAALERNPRVRAVLMVFPGGLPTIDGIQSTERAPLVWSYLQQRFAPAFEENGVVFWVRR
jgi:hypothetical protein